MSDDGGVQISGGGAVAVDTASLRAAADRFRGEARQLTHLAGELGWWSARLLHLVGPFGAGTSRFVMELDEDAGALAAHADAIGERLTQAATVYEIVEQRVTVEQAELRGDAALKTAALARIAALLLADPGADARADALLTAWHEEQTGRMPEITAELMPLGVPFAPVFGMPVGPAGPVLLGAAAAALIAHLGFGRMHRGTTGQDPGPVTVRQVGPTTPGTAPANLTEMVGRVPDGAQGLVRVERYTMPDGSRRYTAYIRGTRSGRLGGTDPSNMTSNLQLYRHEQSTSYKAAVRALELAGAKPGDAVDLVGHSQGGMIAGRIALDSSYRTELLVTAGSPTEAQVSADVLSVQLRHDRDIVPNLTGGGSPAPVGSDGSMVISRDVPLDGGPLSTHDLAKYDETARLAEASADPRMQPVQERIARLQDAVAVDVLQYDATMPEPPRVERPPLRMPPPPSLPGAGD